MDEVRTISCSHFVGAILLTATAPFPSSLPWPRALFSQHSTPLCHILAQNLVDSWHYLGIYGLIMLSTVITVSTTIYYFSIFAGVLFIVTALMLWYYLPCATKLKAQRVSTQSRLVGLVAESLEGLDVIQAFDKKDFFIDEAIVR